HVFSHLLQYFPCEIQWHRTFRLGSGQVPLLEPQIVHRTLAPIDLPESQSAWQRGLVLRYRSRGGWEPRAEWGPPRGSTRGEKKGEWEGSCEDRCCGG